MNFYEVTVRKIAVTFYYGAVALTCGSSFYIQHKTPDFEKPGVCGIISLCY